MISTKILGSAFLFLILMISCQDSSTSRTGYKNRCFEEKLKNLRNSNLYKSAIAEFTDTFRTLKNQKEYFGLPSVVESKIDEAVFFKKDSNECLLIVLGKPTDTLYSFGSARIISGAYNNGHWSFEISLEYNFEKDYFQDYPENSFSNISKLARYAVMVSHNVHIAGCGINDDYWFRELKQ